MLKAKLSYLAKNNLTGRIATSVWGDYRENTGATDVSVTIDGVTATSTGKGNKIKIDEVMQALREGQNCEMDYSWGGSSPGSHAVDLTGMGMHNGQPWVLYSSDIRQYHPALSDSDSRGAGPQGVEFQYLTADSNGTYSSPGGLTIGTIGCEKYIPLPLTETVTGVSDPSGHAPFVNPPPP